MTDAIKPPRITKSDFLLFCEAPRHLWARKHGLLDEIIPSDFDRHLMEEGGRVEALGHAYLEKCVLPGFAGARLEWQETFTDRGFECRVDGLVCKAEGGGCDLYEIKSGTSVDKANLLDVTFQALILEKHLKIDRYFLLHLNKEYIRSGDVDLSALFTSEDVTLKVVEWRDEVRQLREDGLRAAGLASPDDAAPCYAPRDCPCPDLCHPHLPDFSIFDIPGLRSNRKDELLGMGIRRAADIPAGFPLNEKQSRVAELARTVKELLDRDGIAAELGQLTYPLFFLDYETCICALPPFEGYHPQQQAVFQYSLHKLDSPGADPRHCEHLSPPGGDPALPLLESLHEDIGGVGSVVVWNKTFEKTMNQEMARLHPRYAPFLENLNTRIYDLADIVNKGYYLHPGFKGSWSIKNVLPVMLPGLSYDGLDIAKGDQASMAWWRMNFGGLEGGEIARLREALLRYCELDTLAMVEIFQKLFGFIK